MSILLPVVLVVIGFFFVRGFMKHTSTPTFDEFRGRNPELVKDGKICCPKCAGNDVFVKEVGKTPTSLLNHHICKTCGTTLFRSST
jgi:hypothetical protein